MGGQPWPLHTKILTQKKGNAQEYHLIGLTVAEEQWQMCMGASQALAENWGTLSCNLDCIHEGTQGQRADRTMPQPAGGSEPQHKQQGAMWG